MKHEDHNGYAMHLPNPAAQPRKHGRRGHKPGLIGASTLVGSGVYNPRGEHIGDIRDIMLDVRSGKVGYAVLTFGDMEGAGRRLFAVPWHALSPDAKHEGFALNIDRDRLKHAPGFDKDDWPDMTDPAWATEIHAYYPTGPQP
ncbi:photosystem reaction center subunit H [Pandoraea terrae]|uniref:Photosystem reaction center subunit H n=1 Tax=Pandoraea terrae TaxID=1537710 RepID=A0A5E4S9C7_9BURK|nr:PRC-barrel domain-containing protein [Pandoraea terrae]VVD71402.1 photosystem reaction center subunit H [Pandoraea terrae]